MSSIEQPQSSARCEGVAAELPEITVLMLSYNHAPYIRQSVESVFAQRYPGRIRLLVCDDASTDETQAELRRLRLRSPVQMDLILRERNLGGYENLREGWECSSGSYVALLEGDDYWTDADKLTRQVAALEARPDATMSFGHVSILDERTSPPTLRLAPNQLRQPPTFRRLLAENFVYTPTVVYRRGVVPRFPEWFGQCHARDWPLAVLHAAAGEMIYFDRLLATYRRHAGGRWTSMGSTHRVVGIRKTQQLVWDRFGLPDPADLQRVEAQLLLAQASAAERRRHAARAVLAATRAWPKIALRPGYWRGVAVATAGPRGAALLTQLATDLQNLVLRASPLARSVGEPLAPRD